MTLGQISRTVAGHNSCHISRFKMIASSPVPSPLLKATAAIARGALWLMLSAWLLFAAGWGALHLLIVPRIGDLRPQLQAQASKALGVPVTIGAITAQSSGMIPSFELSDVKLFDAHGREALRLPRVLVALSPQSVLSLGFEQLYIDRPALDIRRTANGKIVIAGLDFSKNGNDDGTAADWIFSQAEFVIRNGTVQWTDELRGVPTVALNQVDLIMRNHFRNHSLRLDATPPPDLGDRFKAMAVFKQPLLSLRNGQWRDWDGQLYGAFDRVDVAQLQRHADLGIQVAQGQGALRAWVDVSRGQVVGATADVALAQVNTTLGTGLAPLELQSVTGRLGGRILAGGFEFSTKGLQFETRDGLRWPGGNVRMMQVGSEGKVPARGELVADKLDLAALSQIADRLPLGAQTHATLATWSPSGLVESVRATWQGSLSAPEKYEAKGRVVQLALASRSANHVGTSTLAVLSGPAGPAVRGATIDFDLTQAGGKASVVMENGAIELPGTFDDPVVPLTQLSADAQWQIEGERISVQIPKLKFSNADAQGEAQIKWHTSEPGVSRSGSRFPGVLDLQGSMNRLQGTRVYRYLPNIMLLRVREYVRDAVQKGDATGLKFKVKGDLYDLPFTDPKLGEFRIATHFANTTFAYVPRSIAAPDTLPWPELTQMSGELVIDRLSLQVKDATGKVGGLQITKAEGLVPDLLHSVVSINAEARGALPAMLDAVNTSPLSRMTGSAMAQATATGNAELRLKLNMPLSAIDKTSVQGSVTLTGNDVLWSPGTPRLGRARGVVNFTESGFAIAGGQARMLGGDMTLVGGTVASPAGGARAALSTTSAAPSSIVLRAQGSVTAEGLRQARDLGFVSRIAQHATGAANYTGVLGFRRGVPELLVSSNLVGLALNLPAPAGKTAEAALPVRFENALLRESVVSGGGAPARLLDQLQLDVGRIASVAYVRDVSGDDAKVLRGSIAVGLASDESAPMPSEGVVANINMGNVDMDAWTAVLSQAAGTRLTGTSTGADATPQANSGATSAALGYLPTSMAVRARELTAAGRKLGNVVVGGTRDGQTWRANVEAHELNGYVEYRQPSGAGAGRVYARLARLTLAQSSASDVENLLDEQPASIPSLDVVVDDFELRGKRLGRVEVEAVNRGVGSANGAGGVGSGTAAREWRLNKFNILMPEAVFTATGNWASINAQNQGAASASGASGSTSSRGVPERRRTVMNFKLDINDTGELLTRFGMKDVIRKGKGKLEGQVAWVGSPLSLDYPTLGGAFKVNVETGQFLKADPGLAKLLGVLSLQSLPRRLALDFRDVFTEGFSFDFVRGDVNIEYGIASTNNLQMKGVNAAVLMDGRADIAKETQDIRVIVVPEINAGTASLIATAINPAIGLGTFLAQVLLRGTLIESSTQEFHIDGTWVDPKVTKVARKPVSKADSKTEGAR